MLSSGLNLGRSAVDAHARLSGAPSPSLKAALGHVFYGCKLKKKRLKLKRASTQERRARLSVAQPPVQLESPSQYVRI